ncbi:MAG TPA: DUF4375 domain-containing protein [Mucilaginibacter sp.]|jgi:hypothetical protein
MKLYNTFEKENHLKPNFEKTEFESLHSWDFGWAILEPINIAEDQEEDKSLSKRFSPGQKALYFFWYLDGQVTNGGFVQFYLNGYRKYLYPIIEGLKLIGDDNLLHLLEMADIEYLSHINKFELANKEGKIGSLYTQLTKFEEFNTAYYEINNTTMELIEKYARQNPGDFVNLV